jgi:MFS transporter, UMF1 family
VTNRRTLFSWALFDWAQQPYFTLVGTVGFRPYFVATVAASPVIGQTQIGVTGAIAGLIVALLGPLLGSWLQRGDLKAWLFWSSVPFVVACIGLWWAAPGATGATIPLILLCLTVAAATAEVTITVNNAMLTQIAPPERLAWLSGMGVALGGAGGLVAALIVIAGLFAPDQPLLGLNKAAHEPERFMGPFSAAWYIVFLIPLFLFYPAHRRMEPPEVARKKVAWRDALALLRETLRNRRMFRFMLGRMLIADASGALQTFLGIAVATTLGWRAGELISVGIYSMVLLGVGSAVCSYIDSWLGPRVTVLGSAIVHAVALLGLTSIGRDHIFFVVEVAPVVPGQFLGSAPELMVMGCTTLVALSGGPLVSSMRTWLVQLAPPGEGIRWFGIYAVAGRATAFAAPLTVSAATLAFNDVRAAVPVILAFLISGLIAMWLVPARS